jgi:diguanylate cyclase (GGDEF)-like protein
MLLRRNKRMQQNLFRIANHDATTSLYNRYYLFNYLSEWSKSPESATTVFAAVFIDLDNFKSVNDRAGHDKGDELLRIISGFLRSYTDKPSKHDNIQSLTARIGGDEFVQIVPCVSTPEQFVQQAEKMLADFAAEPAFESFIRDFGIGLSIGGALYPSQADEYSELIRLADIAMYQTKYKGKNGYCLYDESMGDGPEDVVLSVRVNRRPGQSET